MEAHPEPTAPEEYKFDSQLVPEEATTFEPKEIDFLIRKGDKTQRLIFDGDIPFSEEEKAEMDKFEAFLKKTGQTVPEQFTYRFQYRYLQGEGYDPQKTVDALHAYKEYLETRITVTEEEALPILNSGMLYAYKRDLSFRPVVIINVRKVIKQKVDITLLERTTCFFMDLLINQAMVPGRVENFFVIMDCDGMGVTSIPKDKLKAIAGAMQSNYRGRLYKMFLVNVSALLRGLWKIGKGWMDPFTVEKMKVRGELKKYDEDMSVFLPPE